MTTYPAQFFTSGTPHRLGMTDCSFERWLGYHAGKHGTGYRRKRTAIPLATGAAVHDGIALLGGWILEWQSAHAGQRLLSMDGRDDVVAWAASEAANSYERGARARGLELTKTDLDAAAAVEQLILEQRTLIEAQVWIYALARLPVLLSLARLVDCEREETPVLDCTCGLGDWIGQSADHAARDCRGICAQGRADGIWELVEDSTLVYEEVKTKATANYGWEQQWEHSGQLWLNMEAASRRLGKEVSQAFVPVLYKGRRDRTDRENKASPKIQQSILTYGYYDPGNGMARAPEWSARYKWYDDYGKGHTLPRTYQRTAIWDEAQPLLEGTAPNGVRHREGSSRVEQWVKGWILPAQYGDLLQTLGPFPKPRALLESAQQALLVEERRWRGTVAYLRENKIYQASDIGPGAAEIPYLTAADMIARSWQCTKFSGDACQFKGVCHKLPGYDDLNTHPDYEIRVPHHSTEKLAYTEYVESLGLAWPDDGDDDGGE